MSVNYMNGFNSKNDHFEEVKIPVPWGHISGKWWGSQKIQPVIAIHGWQDNAGTFDNLAPLLAKDIPIFCIDLPGHGLSSPYPDGQYYYMFWDGILILRRILKHYKWSKVKIMGHSLGGAIAFLYAATYPDDVECYISIDIASPSVRDIKEIVAAIGPRTDKFLEYERLTEENVPCYEYEEMISTAVHGYGGSLTRESCEILMKRGMRPASKPNRYCFTRDARLKVAVMGLMSLDQVMEFASRITCKVMNIRGDPGMKFSNPQNYNLVLDKIAEKASKLERYVILGTHHLHLNDAASIADIVRNFLID